MGFEPLGATQSPRLEHPSQRALPGTFWRLDGALVVVGLAGAGGYSAQGDATIVWAVNLVSVFFTFLAQVFLVSMPRMRGGLAGGWSVQNRALAWFSLLVSPLAPAMAVQKLPIGWWTTLQVLLIAGLILNAWMIVRWTRAIRRSHPGA